MKTTRIMLAAVAALALAGAASAAVRPDVSALVAANYAAVATNSEGYVQHDMSVTDTIKIKWLHMPEPKKPLFAIDIKKVKPADKTSPIYVAKTMHVPQTTPLIAKKTTLQLSGGIAIAGASDASRSGLSVGKAKVKS